MTLLQVLKGLNNTEQPKKTKKTTTTKKPVLKCGKHIGQQPALTWLASTAAVSGNVW